MNWDGGSNQAKSTAANNKEAWSNRDGLARKGNVHENAHELSGVETDFGSEFTPTEGRCQERQIKPKKGWHQQTGNQDAKKKKT